MKYVFKDKEDMHNFLRTYAIQSIIFKTDLSQEKKNIELFKILGDMQKYSEDLIKKGEIIFNEALEIPEQIVKDSLPADMIL